MDQNYRRQARAQELRLFVTWKIVAHGAIRIFKDSGIFIETKD